MPVKVLLIDNYDSFVFNLFQYLGALGADPAVLRNDASLSEVESAGADAIVISPGPGRPEDSGCCPEVIEKLGPTTPILGVCLGHQAIGVAYGGKVVRAERVMHGKVSNIHHRSAGVFSGLPDPFPATRYHSLVIDPQTLPDELEVTAETEDGTIMGVKHRELPVVGVQFHPESVLTASGATLMANFLSSVQRTTPAAL